ncbi:hypothetical protein JYG36_04960 [Pseudomonas sp. SORT22]|nr:hypothetical protein JYG36_04960 [Pseudomonas sp. SORT22]
MFWKKEKTVRVELVTPVTIDVPASPCQPPTQPSVAQDSATNKDLAVKLVTLGAVASQAALVVYGYSHKVGYYEQFGIDINEVALNTPALLLQGYINILEGTFRASDSYPVVVPGLTALAFVLVAAFFIKAIAHRTKVNAIIGSSTWVGMLLFFAFFVPAIGLINGGDVGRKDFNKFTTLDAAYGLERVQTIVTEKQMQLTGHLILADGKSTFLLVDQTVFKIDDKSGRIIRQVDLHLRSDPSANLGSSH